MRRADGGSAGVNGAMWLVLWRLLPNQFHASCQEKINVAEGSITGIVRREKRRKML